MPYANKEKQKEYRHKYYLEHKEHELKRNRNWEKQNNERRLEKKRKLYKEKSNNPLEIQKRRTRNRQYENYLSKFDLWINKLGPYYEEDHIRRDPENLELLQIRCKYCGKWFNPTNKIVRRRWRAIIGNWKSQRTHGEAHLYCSQACKKACPTYGQLLYPKGFKQATSREVQPELRNMVLERDNWTCQKCGKTKEEFPELELHCHHIDPVINNPIESADEDNCVTLCKDCHIFVHTEIPGCTLSDLIKCSKNKNN